MDVEFDAGNVFAAAKVVIFAFVVELGSDHIFRRTLDEVLIMVSLSELFVVLVCTLVKNTVRFAVVMLLTNAEVLFTICIV